MERINSPKHYDQGDIECIDAMASCSSKEEFQGFLRLNAMKYVWRMLHKDDPMSDIEKALWYLNRLRRSMIEDD